MGSVEEMPQGVQVVGTYRGMSEGDFPKLLIETVRPGTDRPWTEHVEFKGFSAQTGEPTQVGASLKSVKPGDLVSVRLLTEAVVYTDKKTGEIKAFPKQTALHITVLATMLKAAV